MKKKPDELRQLARNALEKGGAGPVMAAAAAQHLVRAEEHGLPTHGISRVPIYCGFLRNGRADGAARPRMLSDRAAVCLIDNCDGLPYESAAWAIGLEADSFFVEKGDKPRIGHAFLAIDPDALTGHGRYFERVEAVITAMLADDLLAKIEKLAA